MNDYDRGVAFITGVCCILIALIALASLKIAVIVVFSLVGLLFIGKSAF